MLETRNVEAASAFLRSLDVYQMLRDAAVTPNAKNHTKMSMKETVIRDNQMDGGLEGRVPPLCVSLMGLSGGRYCHSVSVTRTYSSPIDHSNRLHVFSDQVLQGFVSEGFENLRFQLATPRKTIAKIPLGSRKKDILKYHGPKFLCPQLIERGMATTTHVDNDGWKIQETGQPYYNALGLVEKHKGVVFVDKIPLEKLSLWKNCPSSVLKEMDLSEEHYEEVASISLPLEE